MLSRGVYSGSMVPNPLVSPIPKIYTIVDPTMYRPKDDIQLIAKAKYRLPVEIFERDLSGHQIIETQSLGGFWDDLRKGLNIAESKYETGVSWWERMFGGGETIPTGSEGEEEPTPKPFPTEAVVVSGLVSVGVIILLVGLTRRK